MRGFLGLQKKPGRRLGEPAGRAGGRRGKSGRPFIETLFCKDRCQVFDVQAVAQTCVVRSGLNNRNVSIAIVVAGNCGMQYAKSSYASAFQFHDLVAVLGLSAVSVMNFISPCSLGDLASFCH